MAGSPATTTSVPGGAPFRNRELTGDLGEAEFGVVAEVADLDGEVVAFHQMLLSCSGRIGGALLIAGGMVVGGHGAQFAEVGVDVDTGEIRLRRMLGVFARGRILNHKTARSQLIGGMTWGVGAALHAEAVIDTRSGAFVNRDLAEYLVPVHADIPAIDAIVLDGFDGKANALGAKGIGELSICGAGASIANAVFNATGVRVRDFSHHARQAAGRLAAGAGPELHSQVR